MNTKTTEIALLEMWKDSGIDKVYRYKGRIKTLPATEGKTSFELLYDLSNGLFKELKDVASFKGLTPHQLSRSVNDLLAERKGEVSQDKIWQRRMYKHLKQSLRQFIRHASPSYLTNECVVLIDHLNHTARFFQTERAATDYINVLTKEWEDITEGEEKYLEVIRFCTEQSKHEANSKYDDYQFFRKIKGVKYYRKRKYVRFEEVVDYYPCL